MKINLPSVLLFWTLEIANLNGFVRNIHRKPDPFMPKLTAKWEGDSTTYSIANSHLEEYPLFAFGENDFKPYLIPKKMYYRNDPKKYVLGNHINALIEETLDEILKKKKRLTHCTILKKKNFSRTRRCGLIVAKFKQYPFVVKIFIEKPDSFVNPYWKGLEPICFFYMGGGANRHLSGITRIKNMKNVQQLVAKMPRWKNIVETPRKWFWLPKNNRLIELTGVNIGKNNMLHTKLPSIYAVVADAIDMDKQITTLTPDQKKKVVMDLCNDLELAIDPYIDNFVFVPSNKPYPFKIVIVDTEHFPTIVGVKTKKRFKNHNSWYLYLSSKCFGDTYLRTKRDRRRAQTKKNELALK